MAILHFGSISQKSLAHPHVARNVMFKFQNKLTSSFFYFLRPQENVTPDAVAGQNPGATKTPLPLRAGDKKCANIGQQNRML